MKLEQIPKEIEMIKRVLNSLEEAHKELVLKSKEPEQPTSTRLERLGFYNVGYLCPYFFLSENEVEKGECILDTGVSMQDIRPSNSFKTEQDAQDAAKRREIIADLWRNSRDFVDGGNNNYCIDYEAISDEFQVYQMSCDQTIGAPFFTEDKAKEMIAKHGDDLKLLLV